MGERQYLCIDQKSFYATIECVARGLDPMTADLVVADPERSENTICLAVSVHAKKRGIQNRCRMKDIPPGMDVIVAKPRMQLYIDCSAAIYGVFLKYLAPEDIYVYSIDDVVSEAVSAVHKRSGEENYAGRERYGRNYLYLWNWNQFVSCKNRVGHHSEARG